MNILYRLLKWYFGDTPPPPKHDVIFTSYPMTTHYSYFEEGLDVQLDRNGDYVHIVDSSDRYGREFQVYKLHIGPTVYSDPVMTIDTDLVPF